MSGVHSQYPPELQSLSHWIGRESVVAHDIAQHANTTESYRFLPIGLVEHHFQENSGRRTRDLLIAAFGNDERARQTRYKHAGTVAQHCCRVFCILALLDKHQLIISFALNERLWDKHLPFNPKQAPDGFPQDPHDNDFFAKFVSKQWQFCARVLDRYDNIRIEDGYILPFTYRVPAGSGQSSAVCRVQVHKSHDRLTLEGKKPKYYAIKTFRARSAATNYDRESDAFGLLTKSGTVSKAGLIEFYGGFEYRGTFSIILEYADGGTLEDYLLERSRPQTVQEAVDFWTSLFDLLIGISRIHKHRYDSRDAEDGIILQGWHQDLKPANILVATHGSSAHHTWKFKVTDLGLSHFQSVMQEAHGEVIDRNRHGTRTYGAPETYASATASSQKSVNRSVDIWSLGAIYSEAAVWSVKGCDGVTGYRRRRQAATNRMPDFGVSDCFHNGLKRLSVVDDEHEELASGIKSNDSEGILIHNLARRVYDVLIDEMLHKDPARRPSAETLAERADRILERARKAMRLANTSHHSHDPFLSSSNGWVASRDYGAESSNSGRILEEPGRFLTSPQGTVSSRAGYDVPMDLPSPGTHRSARGHPNVSYAVPQVPRVAGGIPPAESDHLNGTPMQGRQEFMRNLTLLTEGLLAEPSTTPGADQNFNALPGASSATSSPDIGRHSRLTSSQSSGQQSNTTDRPLSAHRPVPSLTVQDLQSWYDKKKGPNRDDAQLPGDDYLLNDLTGRDHVFMVDDSAGMKQYAKLIKQLVLLLVYLTKSMDPDGVELIFLSASKAHKVKSSSSAMRLLAAQQYKGQSSLNGRLGEEVTRYCREIDKHNRLATVPRKRSIYILTDGVLRNGDEVQGSAAIKHLVKKLVDSSFSREQVGIQLIRFGNDPEGISRLEKLDCLDRSEGLVLDIVDTEKCDGNVWKMLHGAINPLFDGDRPTQNGAVNGSRPASGRPQS